MIVLREKINLKRDIADIVQTIMKTAIRDLPDPMIERTIADPRIEMNIADLMIEMNIADLPMTVTTSLRRLVTCPLPVLSSLLRQRAKPSLLRSCPLSPLFWERRKIKSKMQASKEEIRRRRRKTDAMDTATRTKCQSGARRT